jgi:hypothetical protein
MRGPYERTKYDLRRVWECPTCKQKVRTEGHVTSQHCRCQPQPDGPPQWTPMRLIADGARRTY